MQRQKHLAAISKSAAPYGGALNWERETDMTANRLRFGAGASGMARSEKAGRVCHLGALIGIAYSDPPGVGHNRQRSVERSIG